LQVPSFILRFEDHVNSLFHILSGMILTQIHPKDFQGITVFLCILRKLNPVNKVLVYKKDKKLFDNIVERVRCIGEILSKKGDRKGKTRKAV